MIPLKTLVGILPGTCCITQVPFFVTHGPWPVAHGNPSCPFFLYTNIFYFLQLLKKNCFQPNLTVYQFLINLLFTLHNLEIMK